jgi:hypothetical protein
MIEFGTLTEQSVWEDNDVTPMIVVVVFENDRGCNHAVEKKETALELNEYDPDCNKK